MTQVKNLLTRAALAAGALVMGTQLCAQNTVVATEPDTDGPSLAASNGPG